MREIKFRTWNKEKKIMCYKNEDNSSGYWDGVDASVIELINNELNSHINSEEYDFMQFIGLHDKNGKEIYESDIVWIESEEDYFIVEWEDSTARFILLGRDLILDFDDFYEKDLEVAGNIYENEELIREEK